MSDTQYGKFFKGNQVKFKFIKFNYNLAYNNEPDIKNTILQNNNTFNFNYHFS